jgi:WD40 repeat protein
MRLRWVHGALLVGACVACGPKASAPARGTTAATAPAQPAASTSSLSGASAAPAIRPGYTCPPAVTSNYTVIPQGVIFGAAEIQISKDGRVAIVRSTPTELQIWNVPTGTRVGIVSVPSNITRFALRNDGRGLVVIAEGRAYIKDLERGTFEPMAIPVGDIERAEWSTDSKLLFIARAAQTDIIDAGTGKTQTSIAVAPHLNGLSPDGRWILARDGAVWDVRANQQRWRTVGIPINAMYSEDGQSLAIAYSDNRIAVHDPASGQKRWEVTLAGTRASEIAISPDGQHVAVYDTGRSKDPRKEPENKGMTLFSRGKRVKLWQARDARTVRPVFSPDSTKLAFIGAHISEARNYEHEIKIADVATGALVMAPGSRSNSVLLTGEIRPEPPRWSADSRTIFQAGNSGLFVFDAAKGERKVIGRAATDAAVTGMRDVIWSPDDGSLLLVADQGDRGTFRSTATVLDLKTGTLGTTFDAKAGRPPESAQRFRSGDCVESGIITLVRGDGIVVWDGRSPNPTRVLDNDIPQTEDRLMALSPKGGLLASWSAQAKEVRMWDLKSMTRKGVLTIENGIIGAVQFSVDGSRIAVAAEVTQGSERSSQLVIYDVANGQPVRTLHAPLRRVSTGITTTLHWAPQGRAIVAVDNAGHVDLWNTTADDPPVNLLDKANLGPSVLADGGNLLLMGRTSIDVWDLRTRTRARELPGDGSLIEHIRLNHAGTVAAVARGDHIDLFRIADGAHLTIRPTQVQAKPGVLIHADDGIFAGAKEAFAQLRVRDNANQLDARVFRPEDAAALHRPTLGLDFVAGCPMATAR